MRQTERYVGAWVDANSAGPTAPYTTRETAAREIQAAVEAAEAGDTKRAATHRATFNTMHPRASDLFSATLALLVVAVAASPAALAPAARRTRLETPALSR